MAEPLLKERLNVCVIGHVDAGKSTLTGNFMYLLGAIDQRTMAKHQKEADERQKSTFGYAYVTDRTVEEKKRGITISTTLVNVFTDKFDLNILDCPGHKDFIKNMVTGAAQADVGIVVVPAIGFEHCVGKDGILKSHITITAILGCEKLIVCVNKMDDVDEANRVAKFNEVAEEIKTIIKRCHPDKNPIIIPTSAYKGINLVKRGEKFPWFNGWKKDESSQPIFTLEEALDSQSSPPRFNDKPLRMPIVGVHKIPGIGMVYTGRVDSGTIVPNMSISIQPAGVITEVKSLEVHKQAKATITAGENCGIAFKNPSKGDMTHVKAGNVISKNDGTAIKMHVAAVARVVVVDKPKGLTSGYIPIMDLGTVHVPVKIAKIVAKVDTARKSHENPERVMNNESFTGLLVPQKPTVMEVIKDYPSLGRFAIRDSNVIVAIGQITELVSSDDLLKKYGVTASAKEEAVAAKTKATGKGKK